MEFFLYFSNEILLILFINFLFIYFLIEKIFYKSFFKTEIIFLVLFFLLGIFINLSIINMDTPINIYFFSDNFIYSNLINNLKLFIIILFFIFIILFYNFIKIIKLPIFEFLILNFIIILSLFIMISSNNLFFIFLCLEIINLSVYVLVGLNKNSNIGIEISYKYFVQSSYATLVGFLGISFIYIVTGTVFLSELNFFIKNFTVDNFLILGFLLVLFSIFFKLGLFPLHSWIADLYQGAHLIVVTFIAIIPKICYIFIFLQIYMILHNIVIIHQYVLFTGLFSIIYGSIRSLYEFSFRRLIGYGSMVHMGFITLALSLFEIKSIAAAFFYIIFYTILMYFIFIILQIFIEKDEYNVITFLDNITDFYYFLNKNFLLSLLFSTILFSLSGLPFFIGFFSKWYILVELISHNYFFIVFLLLLIGIISIIYYIRIIRFIFFAEEKNIKVKKNIGIKLPSYLYILIIILFFINFIFFFYHNIIYLYINKLIINFII